MAEAAERDLTGARVFRERDRDTEMRWYLLPDDTVVLIRQPGGEQERAIHSAADVRGSEALVEVVDTADR